MQNLDFARTRSQITAASQDIITSVRDWRIWFLRSWSDIKQRYQRSVIGPFWLTISMGVLVMSLGLLYGVLFKLPLDEYIPFLSTGFIVWGLVSGLVLDGCTAYTHSEHYLKQSALPKSIFIFRIIARNYIIFAHNIWIYIIVALWFQIPVTWTAVFSLFGLLLIAINGFWIVSLLALIGARFRDIPQVVANIVQIAFFLTPVLWRPDMLSRRLAPLVDWNPFAIFLTIVREPLLGMVPAMGIWLSAIGLTIGGCLVTFLIFARFRGRIVYWL